METTTGIECEDVECVHLAQDRYQWWGLVNMVTNIRVPYKAGIFLTI